MKINFLILFIFNLGGLYSQFYLDNLDLNERDVDSIIYEKKTKYALYELARMDSIPISDVKSLSINCDEIKADWISIIDDLQQVGRVTICYSKNTPHKLYEKELFEAIGRLENLKSFSVSFDSLETLPPFFEYATQITDVEISGNYLGEIPERFNKLINMEWLLFNVINCNKFPSAMSELKNLKTLHFTSQNLTTLPSCIGSLENLKDLSISANEIRVIPNFWAYLGKLENLSLFCPNLQIMEGSMVELDNLNGLKIYQAFNLINIPDSLGSLHNLSSVRIEAAWKLKSIGNLKKSNSLEWLILDTKNLHLFMKDIYELSEELLSLEIGVFEAMELPKSKLRWLKSIKEIKLYSVYYIENGQGRNADYLQLYFISNVTQEQKENLERLYKILPQIVKLNL